VPATRGLRIAKSLDVDRVIGIRVGVRARGLRSNFSPDSGCAIHDRGRRAAAPGGEPSSHRTTDPNSRADGSDDTCPDGYA